jgi:hypothetical protein
MGSGRRYWLGLGPITDRERARAFKAIPRGKRTSEAVRTFVSKLRKRRHLNRYLKGKIPAATDPSRPWELVFGTAQVGGIVTLMHASGTSTQRNLYLHVIVTIAAHEIDHIKKVFFDGYEVAWDTNLTTRPTGQVNAIGLFSGHVRMQINYGTDSQTALSVPVGDSSGVNPISDKWTANHRQRGHAHVYFRFTYNEELFRSGLPEIEFLVSGHAALIDPRTLTTATAGSQNPAVILYSYLRNTRYGLGLTESDLHTTRWANAANTCDQSISLSGGGTEARYRLNGVFSTDESPGAIIESMLATMAGRLTYTEGKWNLWAGEGRTAVLTITEDMVLSDIIIVSKTPRADSFNSVRGNHNSSAAGYDEADFPEVTNSTYVTEDGGEKIYEDLTFDHVTGATTCQRLSKIELESIRQGIVVELTANLSAYRAEPGEWVALTISRFGWTNKTFEVMRSLLQIDQDDQGSPVLNVRLSLKETAAGIFSWNMGEETTVDLSPDTNLPDAFSAVAPTGLTLASGTQHLYLRTDGTVFSRLYVQWSLANDAFVQNGGYYDIQYKRSSATGWQDAGDVPGSSENFYILDVQDGLSYDVRIRSVSSLGVRSAWTTATGHVVIGKTQAPSTVPSLSVAVEGSGIRLTWSPVGDLDVRQYEIRYGAFGQSWSTLSSTAIRISSTSYFFKTFTAGLTRFRIRAIDTSGNYSTEDTTADLEVLAPGQVQNLGVTQVDNNVLIDWTAPTSGTFPIASYKVYKGATFSGATLLGTVGGSFLTYIEKLGGRFTYWVTALDIAGNEGAQSGLTQVVYNPPDYVLVDDRELTAASATRSNCLVEGSALLVTDNTTETFEQHFTTNSKTTIQGFIDAGYTIWSQPSPASGYAEWTYDLGQTIPQNLVTLSYTQANVVAGITTSPRISWRNSTGDPWTDGDAGASQVFAINFRYVKVRLTFTAATDKALAIISAVRAKIDTKKQTDSGTGTANAADSGGTTVNFNLAFLDVVSIVVTPQATSRVTAVVDFNDVSNPTTFKVLLFDTNGTRVSGGFRWTAEGIVNVIT